MACVWRACVEAPGVLASLETAASSLAAKLSVVTERAVTVVETRVPKRARVLVRRPPPFWSGLGDQI
jgi:hypothetical protein